MTKFDRNYPKTTDKYDTYHKNRKKLRATRETSIFTGGQVNICRKGGGACYSFRCKIYTPVFFFSTKEGNGHYWRKKEGKEGNR